MRKIADDFNAASAAIAVATGLPPEVSDLDAVAAVTAVAGPVPA
jgi:hypothetical protein